MKKVIFSLSVMAAVAAVVVGATTAFFSDTETSTGNTFTAGSIDLKVDSACHYYNIVGNNEQTGEPIYGNDLGCENDEVAFGTWSETDLQDGVHKFFNFADIKPGDKGEDTISLHVYDNDAWGKIVMGLTNDLDNSCTEPEDESTDPTCGGINPGEGELLEAMLPHFSMWLDQGSTPGFQNGGEVLHDPEEGDNVWQGEENEPSVGVQGETVLSSVLSSAYEDDCDDNGFSVDGHNNYGVCHGLAQDGRMVGSTTYYLGLAWKLPLTTGNEVQTDSLGGDVTFNVVQHRNNPTQSGL